MSTPLYDAIKSQMESGRSRFHMPGHKGCGTGPLGPVFPYDMTELPGLESLYEACGPIAETEAAYTRLYGTKASLLSAGGSTLCIQAMLALACPPGSRLVAARGAHTAAINAMALLDLEPVWMLPEQDSVTGLALPVTPAMAEAALRETPDAAAVYLTSPDYYGCMADIAGISEVCRRYGIPLLVDNAHGAHLYFLPGKLHPAALGADLCCDSLHKTLPALTGAALLHIQNEAFLTGAKRAMAMFGSTSSSFLILLSADLLLPRLEEALPAELLRLRETVRELRELALERGLLLPPEPCDPLRLTIGFHALGHTRGEFEALLHECALEAEYLDGGYCVLLPGVDSGTQDFDRLRALLRACSPVGAPRPLPAPLPDALPRRALSLRGASFSPCAAVPVEQAAGRIAGRSVAPCPPGVPIVMPGEALDHFLCAHLKSCGIFTVNVLQ